VQLDLWVEKTQPSLLPGRSLSARPFEKSVCGKNKACMHGKDRMRIKPACNCGVGEIVRIEPRAFAPCTLGQLALEFFRLFRWHSFLAAFKHSNVNQFINSRMESDSVVDESH
jgi:hypothetical protein